MNTLCPNRRAQSGSTLMITLLSAAVLSATLAGYLSWVRTANALVAQSQAWNSALALAEAGVEEGMAQINVSFGTNYLSSLQANWSGPVNDAYGPHSNSLPCGSYSVRILLTNTSLEAGPTIVSCGTTVVPYIGRPLERTVQVTTRTTYAFAGAITALNDVVMNGNNVLVDSYDSADLAHSTPTGCYDPATRKAGGDVASTGGIIDVGNADIYGKLRTAPTLVQPGVGAKGRVGDLSYIPTGNNIQDGWWLNDYNQIFPDVTPPFTSGGITPGAGKGTNTWELGSGNYYVSGNFNIGNNQTLYISGIATLWVTGNFNMSGQNGSFITLAPGATLKLFVGTTAGTPVSADLTTVNVSNGNAGNFQYYGLPSNTSVTWTGSGTYMGTIYAPEASLYLKGSASPSTPSDFQGACVVRSATLDGHFAVHYDENLKRRGPASGFTVASWREL